MVEVHGGPRPGRRHGTAAVAAGLGTPADRQARFDLALDALLTGLPVRIQGEALRALGGPMLSEGELGTLVPALLLSDDTVLVDQPVPLRDIITGLAEVELPGHTEQLLALLPGVLITWPGKRLGGLMIELIACS